MPVPENHPAFLLRLTVEGLPAVEGCFPLRSARTHPRGLKRGFGRLWILTPSPLASERRGGQHGAMQPSPTHTEAAELVKLSPAERQARFYRLEIWPDLFGGFSLVREWPDRAGGAVAV